MLRSGQSMMKDKNKKTTVGKIFLNSEEGTTINSLVGIFHNENFPKLTTFSAGDILLLGKLQR